jgi:hypothetical protein
MLKQARAFGVGMVLATQNPVDVDYKALSNAGTWFIGKLGTDQDKQRLLDGLASAVPGGLDRQEYDHLISALGKRVFLLRNVHEKYPVLFQTRWAMNYLAGPVTRTRIPDLNALVGAQAQAARPAAGAGAAPAAAREAPASAPEPQREPVAELPGSITRPAIPGRVAEYFLPNSLTLAETLRQNGRSMPIGARAAGLIYRPILLAQADVRYLNRKYDLDYQIKKACLVLEPDRRGVVRWENHAVEPLEQRELDREPVSGARFGAIDAPLSDTRAWSGMQSDFVDWIYRGAEVKVKVNETLKIYGGPDLSIAEFKRLCAKAAEARLDVEIDRIEASYEKKIDRVEDKLTKEERELREDEADLARRRREELGTHAETIFGLFTKRRKSVSSSLTKRRMTERAQEDVEESKESIEQFERELATLAEEMKADLDAAKEKWADIADAVDEIAVTPFKKDILVDLFGVAWFPYYLVADGDRQYELPGFGRG